MAELPTGTVTFLFTDIEGSTALWEQNRDAMRQALMRHDALVEKIVADHDGHVVRPRGEGDSRFAVFARATDAVTAAATLQQAFYAEPWSMPTPLRVRMALHTGEADLREGDYYGSAVNRCARLRAVAHGGQTLVSLATEQLVREQLASGVGLRDLGDHRLKDLQHPERVFQLSIDDLPVDFPSLTTLDAQPNNLPVQLTSFIGREQEVETVCARLRDPQVHLLTLTAAGGVGKTRLALQVGAELLDDFVDGVWFVDLAPLSDPTQVPSAIAQVLGVKESSGLALRESLKVFLGEKQVLLVLDNFEHVVAAAPIVSELLAAAPQMKALVTSQSLLHLYGEHQVPLPPLRHPDLAHRSSLDVLSTYAAVELFIQRARAVRPDLVLTNANASAVAGICARLDGIPLAIELAAARVRIFPPQTLLTRLDHRLATLTGGARDRPARHQSLRGTIDWSYQLLDPAEQRLFARLAVFAGGCSLEAAEAVCGEPDSIAGSVVDGLVSLVDKSLLRQQEGADGEPRFTMLESIREYALERLAASGEAAVLCERHARYYLDWLEGLIPSLREHRSVVEDHNVSEMSNLIATSRWIISKGDLNLGVRWYEACFWFRDSVHLEHSSQAWRRWQQNFIESHEPLSVQARAKALRFIGLFARYQHDFRQAAVLLEEALALTRTLNAPDELIEVVGTLGDAYRDQDEYARAAPLYDEFLALAQVLGKQDAIAGAYHTMGELALLQGDYHRALALAQTSRALWPTWNRGIGLPTLNAGFAAMHVGDYELAAQMFNEGLSDARSTLNSYVITTRLVGFGGMAAKQGQMERAVQILGATEALQADYGITMYYAHRREYEWAIATARAGLDTVAWEAGWAEGRAMTLEQAIAYALEEAPDG